MNRKLVVTVSLVALFGVAALQRHGAAQGSNKSTYLTFNMPVSLPGVALGAGTYVFEEASHNRPAPEVVRVMSGDRKLVYYTGFTTNVDRPAGMSQGQEISFGEVAPGLPMPIQTWFPQGEQTGHGFIWTNR